MTNKEIFRRTVKECNRLIGTRYTFSISYGYTKSPYLGSYINIYIHNQEKIIYTHMYDYTNKNVHIELQNLTNLIDELLE